MIKYIITFFLLLMSVFGIENSKNKIDDIQLNRLTNEQKFNTFNLVKYIKRSSHTSKVHLIFNDGLSNIYRIDNLLETFKSFARSSKISSNNYYNFDTKLNIKEIKDVKFFIFDKKGETIAKFECDGINIGRRKIGPFEVPSDKISIASPRIIYY